MFLNIKKMMISLTFLFLLSSCASANKKDEMMEASSSTIQKVQEPTNNTINTTLNEEEKIRKSLRSAFIDKLKEDDPKMKEVFNKLEEPLYENEEKRKHYLDIISKYMRKIKVEYNDPNLNGYIAWSVAKYNTTKSIVEKDLQEAFCDCTISKFVRDFLSIELKLYVEEMDDYLNEVKKRKSKDKV